MAQVGGLALNAPSTSVKAEFERAMRLVGAESIPEVRERGIEIRRESGLIGDAHLPPIVF
ncbi:MAG: hypothetical protein RhofKO_11840 [Rhodothermales bacterium]